MPVQTRDDVLALAQIVWSKYADLRAEFDQDEKYALLQFKDALGLPADFVEEGTVLPTSRELIETAVNHVAPQFRSVEVPRRGPSASAILQAREMTRFYEAVLQMFSDSSRGDPYREVLKYLFTYGLGCLRVVYDPDKIPVMPRKFSDEGDEEFNERKRDFQEAKDATIPFTMTVPHPREIMPDPWGDPPQFMFHVYNKTRYETERIYKKFDRTSGRLRLGDNGALNKTIGAHDQLVEIIEYWDDTERMVLADGQSVLDGGNAEGFHRHRYGFMPYITYSSGFGMQAQDHNPKHFYVGLLRYLRALLEAESRGYSITDIVLKGTAWPARVAEGDNASQMEPFKPEYGMIHKMPDGVKIRDLAPQTPPELLLAHVADTRGRLESFAAPKSTRGVQEPGVGTGFQTQLLLGEARLQYGVVAEVLQKMLSQVCVGASFLLERKVSGTLNLKSFSTEDDFVKVSKRTPKGHRSVTVKVNVNDPADEIRRHQDAVAMVTGGIASQRDGIRIAQPDKDPNEVFAQIVAEKLVLSPEIISVIAEIGRSRMIDQLDLGELIARLQQKAVEQAELASTPRTPPAPESPGEQGAGSRTDQAAARTQELRSSGAPQ